MPNIKVTKKSPVEGQPNWVEFIPEASLPIYLQSGWVKAATTESAPPFEAKQTKPIADVPSKK